MFIIFSTNFFFFALPVILLIILGVCVYRYKDAKRQNEITPESFSEDEIRNRKITMIVLAVIAGIISVIVIGAALLMFTAVAFM